MLRDQIRAVPWLSRRRLLQLMTVAGAAALHPRLLGRLAAGGVPAAALPPYGFLTAEELAILDAATAVVLPTDDRPGAREVGVVDYIQSLLSFLPGSDANCDRLVTAADLTAIAAHSPGAGCTGGDVDGDGAVDARDAQAGASAADRSAVARRNRTSTSATRPAANATGRRATAGTRPRPPEAASTPIRPTP